MTDTRLVSEVLLDGPGSLEGGIDARDAGAAGVEDDGAAKGRVVVWNNSWQLDHGNGDGLVILGIFPVERDNQASALEAIVAVLVLELLAGDNGEPIEWRG